MLKFINYILNHLLMHHIKTFLYKKKNGKMKTAKNLYRDSIDIRKKLCFVVHGELNPRFSIHEKL